MHKHIVSEYTVFNNLTTISMSDSVQLSRQHIAWVDVLRIVACFLVVLAHCCDPFVANFDKNPVEFQSGVLWGSFLRPCVPLFAMISGVLLFPIRSDMGTFYIKRLKRVVIPLIVWALALPLMYYLYFAFGGQTVNPNIDLANYTWEATLNKMYTFVFNFNYDTTPLWYLYMLIGIYLFMPIVGSWLNNATQKDIKIFLGIWVVTMCVPYIQILAPFLGYHGNFGNMGLWGICDWNPYGMLFYFSGFMGYMVLAYYLQKYPLSWSLGKTLGFAVPMFLVGYAITSIGFFEMQKHFPGDYSKLEIVWYFSGINVFLMTFAVYLVMQRIRVNPSPLLMKMASLTFGIYLCHFVLVQCAYDIVYPLLEPVIPPYLIIPSVAVVAFFFSFILVWLLSLTPITRRAIM